MKRKSNKNSSAVGLMKILDSLSNDELWISIHFWLNHPGKSMEQVFLDWKCEDCADFKFCNKKLSPPQCADEAAHLPRIELDL